MNCITKKAKAKVKAQLKGDFIAIIFLKSFKSHVYTDKPSAIYHISKFYVFFF